MLPLNKPLVGSAVGYQAIQGHLRLLLSEYHDHRDVYLYMSAGQALRAVYDRLFDDKGSQRVLVSPLSCYHAYQPIFDAGHQIVFGDIDKETLCLACSPSREICDIVQVTHLGGIHPANLELIRKAKQEGLLSIEDAAQCYDVGSMPGNHESMADYSVYSLLKGVWALGGGYCVTSQALSAPVPSQNNVKLYLYRYLKRFFESRCSYSSNLEARLLALILRLKRENSFSSKPNGLGTWFQSDAYTQFHVAKKCSPKRLYNLKVLMSSLINPDIDTRFLHQLVKDSVSRLYIIHKTKVTQEVVGYLRSYGAAANHLSQNWLETYQQPVFKHPVYAELAANVKLDVYRDVHDRIFTIPFSAALLDADVNHLSGLLNKL